jgi:hypothetical protein
LNLAFNERVWLGGETRRVGRAVMYRLNVESPIVKALWDLAFQ